MRTAEISRKTKETEIVLKLDLDGAGAHEIDTGVGFFNHMLELFAVHANVGLKVRCHGDTDVDFHQRGGYRHLSRAGVQRGARR